MGKRSWKAAAWCAEGVRPGVRRAGDPLRWGRCVHHNGAAVAELATRHFGEPDRRVLLIGGAGFDPRALTAARLMTRVARGRVDGFFFRENVPNPDPALHNRAEKQLTQIQALIPEAKVVDVAVFEEDGAVGLGRRVVDAVRTLDLHTFSDVVVDFSALSIGSSFPATRLLLQLLESAANPGAKPGPGERCINLHAIVTASPKTDHRIVPQPAPIVEPVLGYRGRYDLDETARAAKLWMPQLRVEQRGMLEKIYDHLKPHEVVPVLPFPAHHPRLGDDLIGHYAEELVRWEVDARSIVYADEKNPLDYYRTVLRIDDGRQPVFAATGGSLLILSPLGSKVLALGAMMAAIERDLPVIYVQALSYTADLEGEAEAQYTDEDLVHVWLLGEAYPPLRHENR
jgi:hypothetical protein